MKNIYMVIKSTLPFFMFIGIVLFTPDTVLATFPDLAATNVGPTTNTNFLSSDTITFQGRADNSAAAIIIEGGWADVEIDWGSDGSFDNYNAYFGAKLGDFGFSQSKNLIYTYSNPPVGTHRYRFNVDTDNTGVAESNETNNRSAWVTFVVASVLPNLETYELKILTPSSQITTFESALSTIYDDWVGGSSLIQDSQREHTLGFLDKTQKSLGRILAIGNNIFSLLFGKIVYATPGTILTIPNASVTGGNNLHLFAKIWNTGTGPAVTNFTNEFSYQYDSTSGPWIPFLPYTNTYAQLPPTGRAVDNEFVLVPNIGGDLYIRHCLDIYNEVPETSEDNCTISTRIRVNDTPPALTTPTHTNVSGSGATLGATITNNGGRGITARGTCWGTTSSPTTNCTSEGGTAISAYSHSRMGMPSNTLIYYRGYADNAIGRGYSPTTNFVTGVVPIPDLAAASATVSTVSVNAGNTITFGTGNIANSGTAVAGPYTVGGFYIDSNKDGVADYIQTAGSVSSNTNVGGSNTKSAVWTVPTMAPLGIYRVSYIADFPALIAESDENNNFSGWTSFSVTSAPIIILGTPTGLVVGPAVCGTGQINISWNSVANATGYELYDGATLVYSGANTGYSHTGLSPVSAHSYTVKATSDNPGGYDADLSNAIVGAAPNICAPSAPSAPIATPGSCGTGQIDVSWSSVAGATSYNLKDSGTTIYIGAITPFTHSNLTASSSHSYTIIATNTGGSSTPSIATIRSAPNVCVPTTPAWLTATPSSCGTGQISVAWEVVSDATSYTLLDDSGPAIVTYTGGGAAFAHTGLLPDSIHSYTVKAENIAGMSLSTISVNATAPKACLAPNLVSQNISVAGTYKIGQTLTLSAEVQNAGTLATAGFSDDFSYQWDSTSGAWTPVPSGIFAKSGGLGAGLVSTDGVTFGPLAQSGTLYIQHCVDSFNQVAEGGAETPNCSVSSGVPINAYASCAAGIIAGTCSVVPTAHGATNGVCGTTGYSGACNYTCTDGVWGALSSNSCTPPSISEFKICLDLNPAVCANPFSTLTTATGTPLTASWTASADTCSPITGPGFNIVGNVTTGSDSITANSAANMTNRYQIGCQYGSGVPVQSWIDIATLQQLPELNAPSTIVRGGNTVRLTWDTNNNDEESCTLTGSTLSGNDTLANGTLTSETGYVDMVISGRTTFVLTCGGLSSVKTIEIIPTGWEG